MVVVLWSGGIDSTVAVLRLVEQGHKDIHLLFVDTGSLKHTKIIHKRYEELRRALTSLGVNIKLKIANTHHLFKKYIIEYVIKHKLPQGTPSWAICLTCKAIQLTSAIYYAINNNIQYIADGNTSRQRHYPEQHEEILALYEDFAKRFGMKLLHPVYDISTKKEAKYILIKYNIYPKSLEPTCLFADSFEFYEDDVGTAKKFLSEIFDMLYKELQTCLDKGCHLITFL